MNILDKIIETKKQEVYQLKKVTPESALREGKYFARKALSLKNRLENAPIPGIIAEFKQKSPSRGEINYSVKVDQVTRGYAEAGAAGLSVLTDHDYFGGSMVNLIKARDANPETPILRKEFMIDPYQVVEAKSMGADVILLIAACLTAEEIHTMASLAKDLGLEVLLEIHNASELEKISPRVDMVGVNNRNLKTFEVGIDTSLRLANEIPDQFVKISESGLSRPETIFGLYEAGYKGFLIGETFMKTENPGMACKQLIDQLTQLSL
jgi:indole-3-glycerol phosphate synthase